MTCFENTKPFISAEPEFCHQTSCVVIWLILLFLFNATHNSFGQ
jgi:hypothetical protein